MAAETGADFNHVAARSVGGVVHGVEGGDTFDFGVAAVEPGADFGDGFGGEKAAVLALGDPERGKDEGFEIRIVGFERFQFLNGFFTEPEIEFFGFGCFRSAGTYLDEFAHAFILRS